MYIEDMMDMNPNAFRINSAVKPPKMSKPRNSKSIPTITALVMIRANPNDRKNATMVSAVTFETKVCNNRS